MKKTKVILGVQWGDEGKGKFIDYLVTSLGQSEKLLVARFQGGSNAGHSIQFRDKSFVFHAIPSGILEKNTDNLVGAGVNLDVVSVKKEIEEIQSMAPWWKENLYIALEATVVVPTAKLVDNAEEAGRGAKKIGTTGKAIGPTYSDFYARTDDLGVYEAINEEVFQKRYKEIKESHLRTLKGKFGFEVNEEEFKNEEERFFDAIKFLRTLKTVSCHSFLENKIKNGSQILAEGAQGTLLDVRFGSRRDVTSSYTTAGGVCVGLGLAPSKIGDVIGICKAYATRVGSGPFPTELGGKAASTWADTHKRVDEENLNYEINDTDPLHQGIALRTVGKEYGATTGRLRRCGWLDLPLLKYAIAINGVTELGITKLDILDELKEIPVCVGYEGRDYVNMNDLENVVPVYKKLPGWKSSTKGSTSYEDLPKEAKDYIDFIEKETGVPIKLISTGPKREEMIKR
ncbi:MAG: adenylosuccinate synthase [Patescibacteria group bacterium]|nr:adenylosuccinate synthase [Patescibacteria group bacterium]